MTDSEWAIREPLLPAAKPSGRPRTQNLRAIVDAILYVLRGGIPWRMLPTDLPKWKTVYDPFWQWRCTELWESINTTLRERVRTAAGRTAQPTAAILDSQSVKTAPGGGPRGDHGDKKISGRQRHLLFDTMGLVLKAFVHEADVRDPEAAPALVHGASRHLPPSASCGSIGATGVRLSTGSSRLPSGRSRSSSGRANGTSSHQRATTGWSCAGPAGSDGVAPVHLSESSA